MFRIELKYRYVTAFHKKGRMTGQFDANVSQCSNRVQSLHFLKYETNCKFIKCIFFIFSIEKIENYKKKPSFFNDLRIKPIFQIFIKHILSKH